MKGAAGFIGYSSLYHVKSNSSIDHRQNGKTDIHLLERKSNNQTLRFGRLFQRFKTYLDAKLKLEFVPAALRYNERGDFKERKKRV